MSFPSEGLVRAAISNKKLAKRLPKAPRNKDLASEKRRNARLDREFSRLYSNYANDKATSGTRTADYNAGFTVGWSKAQLKIRKRLLGVQKTLRNGGELNAIQIEMLKTLAFTY